uniref:Dicer-like protein n=1 Tax=Paramecium sexaurelia TaxID=65128 RepID=W1I788_9CILI|nr:Dicer-like protein [Paramecium sexaurelia]
MTETTNVQSIGYLPPQISSHYITFENGQKVLLFLNYFKIDDVSLILISPRNFEYSNLSFTIFSSNIFPCYRTSKKLIVSIEQFKSIVSFNILLFCDLYQNNSARAHSKQARTIESFISPNQLDQVNILTAPGNQDIDLKLVQQYLDCKLKFINRQYRSNSLVYMDSPYKLYNVLYCFDRNTLLIDYFKYLLENQIYKELSEIQQHYQVMNLDTTLLNFFGNKDQPNSMNSVQAIRKKFNSQTKDQQFYLLQQMKHINQMHQQADYQNQMCPDCQGNSKCSFLVSKSQQIFLAGQSELYAYPIPIQFVNMIGRLFSQLVCQMMHYAKTQNANYKLCRLASIDRIEEAISCPSSNLERNYQNLEMLGDSVIKYLTSAMLFEDSGLNNESLLSSLRIKLITNKHLSDVYIPLQIRSMNAKIHYKKIRNHMTTTINDEDDFKLSRKQQADIYEAICGACYIRNYEFLDVIKFFKLTNFGFHGISQRFYTGNSLIKFPDFYDTQIYPLKQYKEIRPFIQKSIYNQSLDNFQQFLGYRLSRLNEAMTVEDYERLEFFGDAILELLVVVNVHKECEKYYYSHEQQQMCREGKLQQKLLLCPGMMHIAKISLLDNGFMGTMALYYGYHQYAIGLCQDTQNEIEKVLDSLRQEDFNQFYIINQYSNQIPKIMSDLWESVAACIMIEYGWEGVVKIYGELYKPFIQYVVQNIYTIYDYHQEINRNIQIEKN